MPSTWLTEQGLFSVQSGWSMLSARVRPWLFDDSEGYKRIRRLLLDLARGPSEISKGLQDNHRFGTASKNVEDNDSLSRGSKGITDLNIEFDSNRLDPYQVGITILSSYTNYPLEIMAEFNQNWKFVSLADCIHACIFESGLFSSSENSEKKFMSMILQFLVYIRDHEYSKEDHKLLANRILSFCSIARISAPRTSTYNLERILKNYFGTKGRLFHISLKDIHKASNYLNLDWKLKWGWSIIITVCFEKAVDRAYSETQKVFGGNAWLMSRTPGRALFFEQSNLVQLEINRKFGEVFNEIFVETLAVACDASDSRDSSNIFKALNKAEADNSILDLTNRLIQVSWSGGACPMSTLATQKHSPVNRKNEAWKDNLEVMPVWCKSLGFPAARGIRRFRLIQSLWQDLLSLRGKENVFSVRPQKIGEEKRTFVYLDCIQLGELLWDRSNWLQSFEKARIVAPVIEGVLAAFISASDTLYPEFDSDEMKFGPRALGGDEIHLIMPGGEMEVENILERLQSKLLKHVENFGLIKFEHNWKKPNKKSNGRLYIRGGLNKEDTIKPVCPKTMWWVGLVTEKEAVDFDKSVEMFLENIPITKDFKRERWEKSSDLFQRM